MNPKNLNQLDPKLKEAYERVMGTPVSSAVRSSEPQAPPHQETQTSPQFSTQVVINQKKKKLSPILIAASIILFFAVYTFFWIKVFNLKIPFLP